MLAKIDEDICMYLGKPVDPVEWYCDWFNIIGWAIAMGKELGSEQLRKYIREIIRADDPIRADITRILSFLEENYTSRSWYGR